MRYRQLGNTDIKVSVLGLGTMTWGHQNSESDAHQQIDLALAEGVNLIDTAEMYPTPTKAETWRTTERYIGTWLAASGRRADVVLASKVVGPARDANSQRHIRDGLSRHDRRNIVEALDGSLKRLQTDYLDLYQLHWPDRTTNIFGQREYPYQDDTGSVAIEETLSVLADQVKAGKVRHIGVSNETPWGVAEFLKQSERLGLPRIVSIQNPYSLLNRLYEGGLSEFSHREGVGLLAYSHHRDLHSFPTRRSSDLGAVGGVSHLQSLRQPLGSGGHCRLRRNRTPARSDPGAVGVGVPHRQTLRHQRSDRANHAGATAGQPQRAERRT